MIQKIAPPNSFQPPEKDKTPLLSMNESGETAPRIVIVGAGLAGVSSYMIEFWPFVVLESVWAIATLIALLKPNTNENT